MDAETLALLKQYGLSGSGIVGIVYIAWQIYLKVKQQAKEDSKGDKLDQRFDQYSNKLQETLDKLQVKFEALQKDSNEMILKLATAQAELVVARSQIKDFEDMNNSNAARIRYLEGLLKEKGIQYAE